jgi:hypothetical protein
VRGGLNLIGSLGRRAARRHHRHDREPRQSIALASGREGVPCTIVTLVGNNPENAAMRAGAEASSSAAISEARERVEQLQHERGLRYVHWRTSRSSRRRHLCARNLQIARTPTDPGSDRRRSARCGCRSCDRGRSRAKVIGVQAERADAHALVPGATWVVGERHCGRPGDPRHFDRRSAFQ